MDLDDPAHSGIPKRFNQTRHRLEKSNKRARRHENEDGELPDVNSERVSASVVQAEGIQPLPQPEQTHDKKHRSRLQWIVEPEMVSPSQTAPFESLGLSDHMVTKLHDLGYENAFAVQTAVIPAVLKAQSCLGPDPLADVLVNSYTGSGKTLAYTVPIVDCLLNRRKPAPRAVVLVPTRPLLVQVMQVFEILVKGTNLHPMALRSERPLQKEREQLLKNTPDILVATPGRLVDHLTESPDLLKQLRFLVVDEADRLLGQSFQEWASILAKACPVQIRPVAINEPWGRPPQRLVFSATLTRDPGKLEALQIRTVPTAPHLFIVNDDIGDAEFVMPAKLTENLVRVKTLIAKPLALVTLLIENSLSDHAIVFVRSNEAAARLARLITLISQNLFHKDLVVGPVSGEMPVAERKRVLRQFASGEVNVIVCTDLIARGIDVPGVTAVINYDLPVGTREYVHRVGRTARAGTSGSAWTIAISSAERQHYWVMQNGITRTNKIEVSHLDVDAESQTYKDVLEQLGKEVLS